MLEVTTCDAPELLGELLLFEISPDYCRESGTIQAADTETPLGTVLMKNADGTLSPWVSAAEPAEGRTADPDPTAVGVLLRAVPASETDMAAPVLRRGAIVSASALKWPADTTEDKKGVALAALEALGIVARQEETCLP